MVNVYVFLFLFAALVVLIILIILIILHKPHKRIVKTVRDHVIDFYHAAAVLHKHKIFCPSSLAVKNLKTSLDGQKKKLLFSWDLTWPPREKGLYTGIQSTKAILNR